MIDCARFRDSVPDDLGDDGRAERVKLELFYLWGPLDVSSHILGHEVIFNYPDVSHLVSNLTSIYFTHPVMKGLDFNMIIQK